LDDEGRGGVYDFEWGISEVFSGIFFDVTNVVLLLCEICDILPDKVLDF
jgi:hypothetical protein